MHALVALIRARLLVKTQQLDFEVDVEQEYEKVSESIKKISKDSKVANKMSAILTRISKWMKVSSKFNKNGATNSMVDLLNELGKEKAIEKIKINVTTQNDGGDNQNMSSDSRIQFNNFINYGIDNMKNQETDSTINAIPMRKAKVESPEERSNSVFVPSPIGYSHSDIMDGLQQGQPQLQIPQSQSHLTPISQTVKDSPQDQNMQKLPNQLHKDLTALYGNSHSSPASNVTSDAENMTAAAQQLSQMLRSKTPSLSEASTGTFLLPRALSIPPNEADDIQTVKYNVDESSSQEGTGPHGKQLQQQEQEFLNDIFSQIDTDIMNSEGSSSANGLGVAPMFDFLGTCGFQTNFPGGDLPIPEDWYKSL